MAQMFAKKYTKNAQYLLSLSTSDVEWYSIVVQDCYEHDGNTWSQSVILCICCGGQQEWRCW